MYLMLGFNTCKDCKSKKIIMIRVTCKCSTSFVCYLFLQGATGWKLSKVKAPTRDTVV